MNRRRRSRIVDPCPVLSVLRRAYPRTPFAEHNRRDPFRVLISCVISQRTRDEQTFRVTERLYAEVERVARDFRFSISDFRLKGESLPVGGTRRIRRRRREAGGSELECRALLAIPPRRLESILRESGFYREKTRRIRAICRQLLSEHRGSVPDGIDELLALPGVGRKTANIVLSMAFGRPAIAVDTHVHRISNRLGWVRTETPEETEEALSKIIPRRWWRHVNGMMVQHGRSVCIPRRPQCGRCPLSSLCRQNVRALSPYSASLHSASLR